MLVLADDLSGAAECAAALHAHGLKPRLLLRGNAALCQCDGCAVVDLDVRDRCLSHSEAHSIWFKATDIGFCKIDSLLRGNWCKLIRSLLEGEATAVLCPALPRLGRHVTDGRLVLSTEESQRLRGSHGLIADLPQCLAAAGLPGSSVLRSDELTPTALNDALQQSRVVVADAQSDADLQRIVQACLARKPRPLLVGSAGLMEALCSHMRNGPEPDLVTSGAPVLAMPVLFLIGSAHPVSRRQLQRLAERSDVVAQADDLRGAPPQPRAGDSMSALWIKADTMAADGRAIVSRFVKRALPMVRRAATLFVSGGETGRVLCDLLGVDELVVAGATEPGVNVVYIPGLPERRMLIKSGSFGDDQLLYRLAQAVTTRS